MATIYDNPGIYDMLENQKRYEVIKRHWTALLEGKDIETLLDVSIGTGNLTLPLCELGIRLTGSDISESMLTKCREKAAKKGFDIALNLCDFRKLTQFFSQRFDCVASTGNSLPYVNNSELADVLEQMDALIKPGGWIYYDMRNWDRILAEKQRFYLYNPVYHDGDRVNVIQVWDYNADGSMTFNLLYTFEKHDRIFRREHFEEHYFPVLRASLIEKLKCMGYADIQLACHPAIFDVLPEKADWYCVMARKNTAS